MSTRSHVRDLIAMMIADGSADPGELALLFNKAKSFGLAPEEVDEIIANADSVAPSPPPDLIAAIDRLYDLSEMVHADGRVATQELELMRSFTRKFGIAEQLVDELVTKLLEEVRAGRSKSDLIAEISEVIS